MRRYSLASGSVGWLGGIALLERTSSCIATLTALARIAQYRHGRGGNPIGGLSDDDAVASFDPLGA